MAKKFLTDINIAGGVYDSSGDIGSSGQVLSSTGSGINWIDANSAASVVYQDGFTGNGSTTAFTLANSIDNENKTQVYIDGVYQHKDNYSLSGTTLTFSTAPPNTSDIEVISFGTVSSADDILYDTDFGSAGLMTTNGSGVYSITTNNSSNWNTAYTYSQVGHLPLAGGTLTGTLGVGSNNINFDDGGRARFGNSSDMQIYHDGSNSIIEEHGDGNLYIRGATQVRLQGSNQSNMLIGNQGGAVHLYHNNSEKFLTLSDGAKVLGTFYIDNKITHTGDGDTWMSFETDVISLRTGGTDRLVLNNTTATITNDLHVGGASAARFKSDGTNTYVDAIPGSSSIIFRNSGAVEKMRLNSSGYLGIGTTSPASLLHIQGSTYNRVQTYFSGSYTSGFKFSDLNGGIWYDAGADDLYLNANHANSQIILQSGGSTTLTLDASNNATFTGVITGIGTYTAGNSVKIFEAQRSGGAVAGDWSYDDATTDMSLGTSTSHSFSLKTGNTRALTINNSQNATFAGNVGINTTAPSTKLHIDQPSNDRAGGLYIERNGSSYGLAAFVNSGGYGIIGGGGSYANDVISMDFNNTYVGIGDTTPDAKLDVELAATNTYDGTALNTPNIIVSNRNSSNVNSQASIISLRSTGWAGSTTGVVNLAAIQAGNASSAHFAIQTRNGGTYAERMRISSDGRVGFGVEPFTHTLGSSVNIDLLGNGGIWGYAGATYVNANAYYNSGWKYKSNGIAAALQVGGSDQTLTFRQAASGTAGSAITYTEAFRVHTDGKVGIGTTSPSTAFHVKSNAAILYAEATGSNQNSSIWFRSNVGGTIADRFEIGTNIGNGADLEIYSRQDSATRFLIESGTGNIGIGTTTPTKELDVNGEITHSGLVPKSGAHVDGLVTINKTVSTSANTWTSLDISLSNIGSSGTFAVQVYSDAHGTTNGSWYTMYWSGIMSWYHSSVNSGESFEIPLHASGHAMNASTLELRTRLHTADGTSYANRCELQIKTSSALSSAPISFRFRKLL